MFQLYTVLKLHHVRRPFPKARNYFNSYLETKLAIVALFQIKDATLIKGMFVININIYNPRF